MKALSLTQPWASLIAIGAKKIETRSWQTSYRGPIAIHATKAFPDDCRALCLDLQFSTPLKAGGFVTLGDIPRGAIVAIADVVTIVPTTEAELWVEVLNEDIAEQAFGNYSPGRFAWLLEHVKPLRTPIACTGALGLWTVPPDIAALVEQALTVTA